MRLIRYTSVCAVLVLCLAQSVSVASPAYGSSATTQHMARTTQGDTVVVWENTTESGIRVYAQRYTADGMPVWDEPGIQVNPFRGNQTNPRVVSAPEDGVFVIWQSDAVGQDNINLWCQRLSPRGERMWRTPVPISVAPGNQINPVVAADVEGGFFVVWEDYRFGKADIYGQYIQSDGAPAGTEDGVAIEVAPGHQRGVHFTFNDKGEPIGIAWRDYSSPLAAPAEVSTDITRIPIPEPNLLFLPLLAAAFYARFRAR